MVGGLGVAVVLRALLSVGRGPGAPAAALVFAAFLSVLAVAGGWRPGPPVGRGDHPSGQLGSGSPREGETSIQAPRAGRGVLAWGALGAAGLVAGPVLRATTAGAPHRGGATGLVAWAVVVATVVAGEEILLRGALWQSLAPRLGTSATVAVTATLFAALHVPLYGLKVLPLDLAAGAWLGMLRAASASVGAPALAHLVADWSGWWLG